MPIPSDDAAKRIRSSVKWTESQAVDRTWPSRQRPVPGDTFWVEITGSSGGAYSWKRKQPNSTGSSLIDDADTITGTNNAYEVNGASIPVGAKVLLRFAGYSGATPIYLFLCPMPSGTGESKVCQLDSATPGVAFFEIPRFTA